MVFLLYISNMSLLVDVLVGIFGDYRDHNPYHGQVSFNCPYCDEGQNKGNLEMNYLKGVYKCWVCGETHGTKGSLPYLVKKFASKEELKDFKLFYDPQESKIEKNVIVDLELPEEYIPLYFKQNRNSRTNKAISYLKKRGIDEKIIDKFKIGVCLNGRYFNRIVVPCYDVNNKLNYYITRDFSGKAKNKYDNPRSDKTQVIINEHLINYEADIYLVEGIFDHIVVPNSIPLLGVTISDLLFETLLFKSKANIIIFLDGEAYEQAEIVYNRLNIFELEGRVKIIRVNDGYDPSLINQKFGKKGIYNVLGKSFKIKKRGVF